MKKLSWVGLLVLLCACNKAAPPPQARDRAATSAVAGPSAAASTTPPVGSGAAGAAVDALGEYRIPATKRLVAVGDLHGDINAAVDVLRLAGAIDEDGQWAGGDLTLVQTGDLLDRGDTEREILALMGRLAAQASAVGGQVVLLNGNHETMNVAGDFRYVTQGGFDAFSEEDPSRLPPAVLRSVMAKARGRAAAFFPGGSVALELASHPVVVVVGDTVFAHGGVLPEHVDYGVARLNHEAAEWLSGRAPARSALLSGSAPVWTRLYSEDPVAERDCAKLAEVLRRLQVKRMVVGHTIKPQVDSACGDRIWRIDVGMSAYYGGQKVQALEIVGDSVRVLSAPKSPHPR